MFLVFETISMKNVPVCCLFITDDDCTAIISEVYCLILKGYTNKSMLMLIAKYLEKAELQGKPKNRWIEWSKKNNVELVNKRNMKKWKKKNTKRIFISAKA